MQNATIKSAWQTDSRPPTSSARRRLVIGSVLLFALPLIVLETAGHWSGDAELFTLLRGMAAIKAALALLALTAAAWRLGQGSAPRAITASYVGGVWAMALAAGLIWQLTAIVAASALFHAATIALLVTAWRDMEPLSARTSTRHLRENDGQRPSEGHRAGQRADDRVAGRSIHPAADQAVDEKIRNDHHRDDQQEEQFFERHRYG